MIREYVEERNGRYYIAGKRISFDWVVCSFERGNSPEAIQREFPVLRQPEIYGAIALYVAHQSEIRRYLEEKERRVDEISTPSAKLIPICGPGFSAPGRIAGRIGGRHAAFVDEKQVYAAHAKRVAAILRNISLGVLPPETASEARSLRPRAGLSRLEI